MTKGSSFLVFYLSLAVWLVENLIMMLHHHRDLALLNVNESKHSHVWATQHDTAKSMIDICEAITVHHNMM